MSAVVLRTENLTKHYGSLIAVDHLNLEVYQGEILGFLGPNGAGKTTSINMICGLLRPDEGEVWILDQPVTQCNQKLHLQIGVCPQSTVVWSKLTCKEQLEFMGEMYGIPRRDTLQRGEQLLEILGLAEKRNQLAGTLSGGMQRRLNLALALVHSPKILVLDEPEAGLDPQSRVMVREYIRAWASTQDRTVILTTHNMDEAERMAQRVAIIDHGALLVVDTPEALKHRVGEGDVLEIDLNNQGSRPVQDAVACLGELALQVQWLGSTLVIRRPGVVALLSVIYERLQVAGFQPGEVRLRENSLEDVFISLTGRRLRE
jgi:ABC-2 type transport system ATP-binding protein